MVLYSVAAGNGDKQRQEATLDADFPEVRSVSSPDDSPEFGFGHVRDF